MKFITLTITLILLTHSLSAFTFNRHQVTPISKLQGNYNLSVQNHSIVRAYTTKVSIVDETHATITYTFSNPSSNYEDSCSAQLRLLSKDDTTLMYKEEMIEGECMESILRVSMKDNKRINFTWFDSAMTTIEAVATL